MITRRSLLRGATLSLGAASVSGWLGDLAAQTSVRPPKSIILLWMNGGPATIDLFDLKPGHDNGGPYREIQTNVPGIRIGEHLPRLSRWAHRMAIVRSLSSREGDHGRASHLLRTGYVPQAAIQFPALGALVAHQLGAADTELPNFVSIAPVRSEAAFGAGFLGPRHAPLSIGDSAPGADLSVPNIVRAAGVSATEMNERLDLLRGVNSAFLETRGAPVSESLNAAAEQAVRMMSDRSARVFHFDEEPRSIRDTYGVGVFGQGCLLARRLVEREVPFVEVTLDGWDTHNDNFRRVADLCGSLDRGWSALLSDLDNRGLLDTTLVAWMGEFGRTPRINNNNGRDHWPGAFAAVLAGGGIRGGRVIGSTSPDGLAVADRPVRVPDLLATIVRVVGIDPMTQNMSNVGRPIRVADPTAQPIEELL